MLLVACGFIFFNQKLCYVGEDFSGARYFPIPIRNHDLSYSGLYPQLTTSDPRSSIMILRSGAVSIPDWIRDQPGAVPSIATIATYPVSFIALISDRWTIDEFEILSVG